MTGLANRLRSTEGSAACGRRTCRPAFWPQNICSACRCTGSTPCPSPPMRRVSLSRARTSAGRWTRAPRP
eukprot:15092698-Heterocapsa_arctica.AAC.1